MSTVITDGYRLKKKLSLNELQVFSMELRTQMEEIAVRICEKLMAERITDIIDTLMARGGTEAQKKLGKEKLDTSSPLFSEAYSYLWKEHQKIKKGEVGNSDANFDCKVAFFPIKRALLAIFLCSHKEYREAWEGISLVEEYQYYNNTDRPEHISKGRWERRSKNWDEALIGRGIPSLSGMTIDLVKQIPVPQQLRKEEILKHIPSFEERVRQQARDRIFAEKWLEIKGENTSADVSSLIYQVKDWLRSEEGKSSIEREQENVSTLVKPSIQEDDILKSINEVINRTSL